MRLAQEDILRYTIDASWVSPDFPEGYWPKETGELTEEAWAASVAAFYHRPRRGRQTGRGSESGLDG